MAPFDSTATQHICLGDHGTAAVIAREFLYLSMAIASALLVQAGHHGCGDDRMSRRECAIERLTRSDSLMTQRDSLRLAKQPFSTFERLLRLPVTGRHKHFKEDSND